MTLENLKVMSASVRVNNSNDSDRIYDIEANFNTKDGKLTRVDGGIVTKSGMHIANFYTGFEGENSTTITYYNEANESAESQCAINTLINEFIDIAAAKATAEAID